MYHIKGNVKQGGVGIETTIRAFNRDNGYLIGETTSDENGAFDVRSLAEGVPANIVALDPTEDHNDLIYKVTPVLDVSDPVPPDVDTAVYTGKILDTKVVEWEATSFCFSPDGINLYTIGRYYDNVRHWKCSIPWDVSTATCLIDFYYLGSSWWEDISFKPDGTKFYITGFAPDYLRQYSLSTPWDLSTTTYEKFKDLAVEHNNPSACLFSEDGSKAFTVGFSVDYIKQWSLSTSWDIATMTYDGNSLYIRNEEANPYGIHMSPDGKKLYLIGDLNNTVFQYTLSTPWAINTASYDGISFDVGTPTGKDEMHDVLLSPDSKNMFVIDHDSDTIFQFSL